MVPRKAGRPRTHPCLVTGPFENPDRGPIACRHGDQAPGTVGEPNGRGSASLTTAIAHAHRVAGWADTVDSRLLAGLACEQRRGDLVDGGADEPDGRRGDASLGVPAGPVPGDPAGGHRPGRGRRRLQRHQTQPGRRRRIVGGLRADVRQSEPGRRVLRGLDRRRRRHPRDPGDSRGSGRPLLHRADRRRMGRDHPQHQRTQLPRPPQRPVRALPGRQLTRHPRGLPPRRHPFRPRRKC